MLGQAAKPQSTSGKKAEDQPTSDNRGTQADEMREHQLRVFREHVLSRAVDNIKKMDEAGLRISARNQILSYLATDKSASAEKQALATQIARDALIDLREHSDEIIPFMLSYLSNDLGSWIQKHRPSLSEDFEKTIKATAKLDASQRIRSLFDQEGGDELAAKRIRQELANNGTLNGLNFWLDELLKRNSKEFEPVAAYVVATAAQGQLSLETMFWVSDVYLRPQTSSALRNRFLTIVVARTHPANFIVETPPQFAYDLLTKLLPAIQRSTPELYDQAQNHSFALRASLNERQAANEARIKRLAESINPVADLKSEAEAAKTKTERNELLLQAAQLALEKKQLDMCLDILSEVDVSAASTDPGFWQRSIDQTLRNLVRAAIGGKLPDVAEKGAGRINSALKRVEALNLIMRYYAKSNVNGAAQRLLAEASKVAETAPNTSEKAKAFFLLSITCDAVDESRKTDLLQSGIKALNNLSQPNPNGREKTIYQTYVQHLDNAGYELTKSFKSVTKQDENAALALVERIQKPDLKTFALIGVVEGLNELLTTPGSLTKQYERK